MNSRLVWLSIYWRNVELACTRRCYPPISRLKPLLLGQNVSLPKGDGHFIHIFLIGLIYCHHNNSFGCNIVYNELLLSPLKTLNKHSAINLLRKWKIILGVVTKRMFRTPFLSCAASLPDSTAEPMVVNVGPTVVGWCLIVHIEAPSIKKTIDLVYIYAMIYFSKTGFRGRSKT